LIVGDSINRDLFRIDTQTLKIVKYNFTDVETPTAIGIDPDDQLMFWVDSKTQKIYRANLNGTNKVLIKSLPTRKYISPLYNLVKQFSNKMKIMFSLCFFMLVLIYIFALSVLPNLIETPKTKFQIETTIFFMLTQICLFTQ
jgi:hypothetical protein